jgi:hypothetical protein
MILSNFIECCNFSLSLMPMQKNYSSILVFYEFLKFWSHNMKVITKDEKSILQLPIINTPPYTLEPMLQTFYTRNLQPYQGKLPWHLHLYFCKCGMLLAYENYEHKSFNTLTPGACTIKLFTAVICGFL